MQTTRTVRRRVRSSASGQSIVEFALVLPFLVVLVLGIAELGYALLDSHIVTKMTRESSNLISRDASIQDAVTAMTGMSSRPVNFTNGSSKIIFSVVMKVSTTREPQTTASRFSISATCTAASRARAA